MPEIFTQPGEHIISGQERDVFTHPTDENKVIKQEKDESEYSIRQKKGEFYLTRLLQILVAGSVPDIQAISQTKTIQEKIPHNDKHHERVIELNKQYEVLAERIEDDSTTDEELTELGKQIGAITEELESIGERPQLRARAEEIERYYFGFEDNPQNFIEGEEGEDGQIRYIDEVIPFFAEGGGGTKLYHEENIQAAIDQLPDGTDKIKATRYLTRLNQLYQEEIEAV